MSNSLIDFGGVAHLCLANVGYDGTLRTIQGHVHDPNSRKTYGLFGEYTHYYQDPEPNECLEPDLFYELEIYDYDERKSATVMVRRPVSDDAAGFATSPVDDEFNHKQTCSFEPISFYSGRTALNHCRNYIPQVSGDVRELVVLLGLMHVTLDPSHMKPRENEP
ncbi:uncharacterized protein BYT42DRAFT_406303 [Radiomyces spectabilis]|uniref:uncharacterized protein n=1 Tax=Radiomyces spectabilis TaxID=64574 RepID=UPI0022209780|nr:uncharacterized protein BYT42DRAFT_406303 [Radiomyces spectabilis]KAI8374481.1 hypothetical protein BYT42DRAFT_406303 [Radiomyces spectabilis]